MFLSVFSNSLNKFMMVFLPAVIIPCMQFMAVSGVGLVLLCAIFAALPYILTVIEFEYVSIQAFIDDSSGSAELDPNHINM